MVQRMQVTMDPKVVKRIDAYAEANGLNRSAFLQLAAESYIEAKEKMPAYQAEWMAEVKKLQEAIENIGK